MMQHSPTRRKQLAALLEGEIYHCTQDISRRAVASITTDSRMADGESLFIAIQGLTVDGHHYIADAFARGCRNFLVGEHYVPDADLGSKACFIRVADPRTACSRIAAVFYDHPCRQLTLVGITGTNGKTTSSFLLESVIAASGGVPGVIGTINYRYANKVLPATHTTPDPLILQGLFRDMLDNGVTHVVMEVSSHALEQGRVGNIDYDLVLFTNLSRDHLDYHADMAAYYQAKRKLFFDHLKPGGVAVVCVDEQSAENPTDDSDEANWGGARLYGELEAAMSAKTGTSMQLISCGLSDRHTVFPLKYTADLHGLIANVQTPDGAITVKSSLIGRFNLENCLGVVGCGIGLQLPLSVIARGIETVRSVPGRLEKVAREHGRKNGATHDDVHVYIDYAHTPDALKEVLQTIKDLDCGRLTVVFGCGGDRDQGKRAMMGKAAGQLADRVVLTADNSRSEDLESILDQIEQGIKQAGMHRISLQRGKGADVTMQPQANGGAEGAHLRDQKGYDMIPSRSEAIRAAITSASPGEVVLICGKGHETYQIDRYGTTFFDDRLEARQFLSDAYFDRNPQARKGRAASITGLD